MAFTEFKADVVREFATKADLQTMRTEVAAVVEGLKHVATKAEVEAVRTEVERMGRHMLMWVVATMLALAAVMKWLP